ncbi:MAG: sigma 54-interacting transcriptional regulator [Kiritimatiellae bacterium]|nr:sigma 54-interacting transcriptional regulator [Kiritimatiellia bacterium]
MILNSISDGILAHDPERHIFFFNTAAEKITGYKKEEVLGRDCHEVFPGNFCGGKCKFCDGSVPNIDEHKQNIEITTKSGEKRLLDMTIRAMLDRRGTKTGFLVSFKDLTREHNLARRVGEMESFSGILGRDKKMLDIFDLIRELADVNVPVLIQGESGTGKELVAAAIHNEGLRANKLFVPVNCGALPESLLESELFGHVKGAFTGAIRDKKGRFELADGGTIFLDEIGDISPAMQVKLLRVLQESEFQRVGSEKTMKVNVRVISATNKDISSEMTAGRFREDLFYRLSVVPIHLPPLRERRNDIPLLAKYMLKSILKETGRKDVIISPSAMDLMMSHNWPGNVRELQNWIQFALVKCHGNMISPEHLPTTTSSGTGVVTPPNGTKKHRRRKLNIEAVKEALLKTNQNRLEAAKLLGVSRATFYRFLDDTGIVN